MNLNCQVAELVFKWTDVKETDLETQMYMKFKYEGKPPGSEAWTKVPSYCADAHDNLELIDKLTQDGYSFFISRQQGKYIVSLVGKDNKLAVGLDEHLYTAIAKLAVNQYS